MTIKYTSEIGDLTFYGSFKHKEPNRKKNELELRDRPQRIMIYPKEKHEDGTFGP